MEKHPAISLSQASELLAKHYGIRAVASKTLAGEVDYNFYFELANGHAYTMKISRPDTPLEAIAFQVAMMEHLAQKDLSFATPHIIKTTGGDSIISVSINQSSCWLRLQSWVAGRLLGDVNPRTSDLRKAWGATAGQLALALQDFDHPGAHRSLKWDPSNTLLSRNLLLYFTSDLERTIAKHFWDFFENNTQPLLANLRKSVNYSDAHEHNLLVSSRVVEPEIIGVIDFGDAVYSETINELAIACAYAGMYAPAPLEAMSEVVAGFHTIFSLKEEEVAVLFSLITARLLITVSNSARAKAEEPDNPYLLVSEKPAWDLLKLLYPIHPNYAHFSFRYACGWEASPKRQAYDQWINLPGTTLHHLVDFSDRSLVQLDFSVGSLTLGNNANFNNGELFKARVKSMIAEQGGHIGVGGYGEVRPFYTTDAYATKGNDGPRWRTTHLGYDIWAEAGTPVYAPLRAKVHSFKYDPAHLSYGATIILEHQPENGPTFYTLYGHLSKDSLIGLQLGQAIEAGQEIARFGPESENGGWPPHLHFQLMLDTLGLEGDFPGVAYPELAPIWLSLCPDPKSLIKELPAHFLTAAHDGAIETGALLAARQKLLGRSLSISYHQPLHIVRGWQQYLYDTSGRRYLDTVNNVAHVGHEHPKVVAAGQRQMAVLNTNTRYLHSQLIEFANELAATFPPALSVVHFVNSGSEANELALRMAESWAGTRNMVAVEVGYHGNTGRTIDISSYKFDGKGGKGAPSQTQLIPRPDVFRGRHRNPDTAGYEYAKYVQQAIVKFQERGEAVGGFICESVLSCGGQIVLPKGFLSQAYTYTRAAGGLCIADEVQVGVGRAGDYFWAFEQQGVIPDIVTIGKPIGNGHPLGAVVCTPAVAERFANGMEYFNTFGGNPVSCAIGRAVLQLVKEAHLQQHAQQTGTYLIAQLQNLQQQYPIIGDVRGLGLFIGFELVTDPVSLNPATQQAAYLKNRMRQLGFLMSTDGPDENVIKIKPPLAFNQANADLLITYLTQVLAEDAMQ